MVLTVGGCVPGTAQLDDSGKALRQVDGSAVWLGEYRFEPPAPPWVLIDLNDRDLTLAYYKPCRTAASICEVSIAYTEEPFGSSRELPVRIEQLFRRHLWAARVAFAEPEWTLEASGGVEELVAWAQGTEPVTGQKVLTKVRLRYRGERVVAFFMNQWRGPDAPFDRDEFAELDRFAASFRFLTPSFYEKL
jgi:hypothetical protein